MPADFASVLGFWLALILTAIATVAALLPVQFGLSWLGNCFVPLSPSHKLAPCPAILASRPPPPSHL